MGWDTEGETRRERHKTEGGEGSGEHRPTANDTIRDCLSTLEVTLISFSLLKVFIYSGAPGLHGARRNLHCIRQALSLWAMHRLSSLERGLSSCGESASLPCGM